jgi:hypothetical protein
MANSARRADRAGTDALRGEGQPLEEVVRAKLEPRFGYDFEGVRVHASARAADAARAERAIAFTIGNDIVFAAGQYRPRTAAGMSLIAHELVHVVQQSGTLGEAGAASEHALEREAQGVARLSGSGGVSLPVRRRGDRYVARQADPKPRRRRSHGLTEAERQLLNGVRERLVPPGKARQQAIVGVLIADDGRRFEFVSGGGQGFSSHVEGKATAKMEALGIRSATLLVEKTPCQICDRSTYSQPAGPEEPMRSSRTGRPIARQTPKINTALPIGHELAVVDPESTSYYRGVKSAPRLRRTRSPRGSTSAKPGTPEKSSTPPATPKPSQAPATSEHPPKPAPKPSAPKPATTSTPPTSATKPSMPAPAKPAPAKAAPAKPAPAKPAPAKPTPKPRTPGGKAQSAGATTVPPSVGAAGKTLKGASGALTAQAQRGLAKILADNPDDKELAEMVDGLNKALAAKSFISSPKSFIAGTVKDELIKAPFRRAARRLAANRRSFVAKYPSVRTLRQKVFVGEDLDAAKKGYERARAELRKPAYRKGLFYIFVLLGLPKDTPPEEVQKRLRVADQYLTTLPGIREAYDKFLLARFRYSLALAIVTNRINLSDDELAKRPTGEAADLRRRRDALVGVAGVLTDMKDKLWESGLVVWAPVLGAALDLETLAGEFKGLSRRFGAFADLVGGRRREYRTELKRIEKEAHSVEASGRRLF